MSHPTMILVLTEYSGGPRYYYTARDAAKSLAQLFGWGFVTSEGTERLPNGSWPEEFGRFTVLFEHAVGLDLTALAEHSTQELRDLLDSFGVARNEIRFTWRWKNEDQLAQAKAKQREIREALTKSIEEAIGLHLAG